MEGYSNKIVVSLDDGYFPHPKKKGLTTLAGVISRGVMPFDCRIELVEVDGTDATEKAARIISFLRSRYDTIDIVLLDGVTYAGFNFIDPEMLAETLGEKVDYIIVFRKKPNSQLILAALRKHFADWEKRWSVIGKYVTSPNTMTTRFGRIFFSSNLETEKALKALEELQVYSPVPEPLRIADMLASAASRYLRRKGLL